MYVAWVARQLPGPIGLAPIPRAFILQTILAIRGAARATLLMSRLLHIRSANAQPRGQARCCRFDASISSPHRLASPPITKASCEGVKPNSAVPLSGSKWYTVFLSSTRQRGSALAQLESSKEVFRTARSLIAERQQQRCSPEGVAHAVAETIIQIPIAVISAARCHQRVSFKS